MANSEKNGKQTVSELKNGNLVVVREPIMDKDGKQLQTKDGRPFYAYVVRGKIRNRDTKVDFVPKDNGGYEPLDFVFDVSDKAELIMREEIMTDAKGRDTSYTSYVVRSVDEDGCLYECGVKPQRDSDKSLLGMLLNGLRVKTAVEQTA